MVSTSLTDVLRETLALFEDHGEPRTTTEVAEQLDLGRRSTYERLERLVDHGRLETKKVGGNGRVWWRPPSNAEIPPDWPLAAESLIDDVLEAADVGIFVLDEDFDIAWINNTTERFFGLDRSAVLGRDKRRVIEEQMTSVIDEGEAFTETVLATYDDNTCTEQFECRVTPGQDREGRLLEHRSKPIESGTYAGGRIELYYDVTERKQRERLVAINNFNEVVRDIIEAVIEQSTREEIETIVCERLAGTDSYEFAWIGEVDPRSKLFTPCQEAGVEGYLDEIPISTDADVSAGRGPAGRAVRTKEVQVTQNVFTDPEWEPWREFAREYGYRSTAVIPIVHGDTLYGVLGVYADRPQAFDDEELDVIAKIGEVVGHAIAAIERKRALMSDEVTEIEFSAPDILASLGVDMNVDGTIEFDRVVPNGEETFLKYGTVEEDAIDVIEVYAEQSPAIEQWKIFGEGDGAAGFEFQLSEPPVVSVIASHGGYVPEARIEEGDLHMSIHLPPTVEVRRVLDVVNEAFPTATLLSQRQIVHDESSRPVHGAVSEDLTERQRATLEAAVYSGYFEWPRQSNGEEVAASLDIAPPTFHQHLRKAQRKVFESVFPVSA